MLHYLNVVNMMMFIVPTKKCIRLYCSKKVFENHEQLVYLEILLTTYFILGI